MNKFDELKQEILNRFPHYRSEGIFKAIVIYFFGYEGDYWLEGTEGKNTYRQSAVITTYKGKDYFKRWGSVY